MIHSLQTTTSADVAGHYDELDHFYRKLWGDHVHHGLWRTGRERPREAVEQLIEHVVAPLEITAGQRVCDVGCGYGGTSRHLAKTRRAQLTGLTISTAQYEFAVEAAGQSDNPRYLLQNWETNSLDPQFFDALVSIECLSHVENKDVFFEQVFRVLRPGGRAVIVAWLASDEATEPQRRQLLEPICREGRLPGMGSADDYRVMIADAGLELIGFEDLSSQVAKTWSICLRRVLAHLCVSPSTWWFLLSGKSSHAVFLLTLLRLRKAYRTGAMRYGVFTLRRPAEAADS